MKKNHFDIISSEIGKIKLLRMEYVDFDKSDTNYINTNNKLPNSFLWNSTQIRVRS